jgi:hypothetical protein
MGVIAGLGVIEAVVLGLVAPKFLAGDRRDGVVVRWIRVGGNKAEAALVFNWPDGGGTPAEALHASCGVGAE